MGDKILSPCAGTISKLGYCYDGSQKWRYVQITDAKGLHHRIFYVQPQGHVGKKVRVDDVIGIALDISARYPGQGMKDHIHYEVKKGQDYLDPNEV